MDLGILAPVVEFVDAHFWTLVAFIIGIQLGFLLGLNQLKDSLDAHQNTIREFAQLLGHFRGCVEVLEENDLLDDARERGIRYAEENMIDLATANRTTPSRLDRVRDLLPF